MWSIVPVGTGRQTRSRVCFSITRADQATLITVIVNSRRVFFSGLASACSCNYGSGWSAVVRACWTCCRQSLLFRASSPLLLSPRAQSGLIFLASSHFGVRFNAALAASSLFPSLGGRPEHHLTPPNWCRPAPPGFSKSFNSRTLSLTVSLPRHFTDLSWKRRIAFLRKKQ